MPHMKMMKAIELLGTKVRPSFANYWVTSRQGNQWFAVSSRIS
jgi:hypothetical protein